MPERWPLPEGKSTCTASRPRTFPRMCWTRLRRRGRRRGSWRTSGVEGVGRLRIALHATGVHLFIDGENSCDKDAEQRDRSRRGFIEFLVFFCGRWHREDPIGRALLDVRSRYIAYEESGKPLHPVS